jgi:hypothetical protein
LGVRLERLWIRPALYETTQWQEVLAGMEKTLEFKFNGVCDESACSEILKEVRSRIEKNLFRAPFALLHNGDFALAKLCYLACRALKPAVVLETGVAYGVTSAFILKALDVNGRGVLHSIDLPPLDRDADQFVGILIPPALKNRWELHRGTSRRLLPALLLELQRVDLFVHDSLHTYRNINWELKTVRPHLGRPCVVIADDVENNSAFSDWIRATRPNFSATLQELEKKDLFGVSVFR